jgi:hypothetical protein
VSQEPEPEPLAEDMAARTARLRSLAERLQGTEPALQADRIVRTALVHAFLATQAVDEALEQLQLMQVSAAPPRVTEGGGVGD